MLDEVSSLPVTPSAATGAADAGILTQYLTRGPRPATATGPAHVSPNPPRVNPVGSRRRRAALFRGRCPFGGLTSGGVKS